MFDLLLQQNYTNSIINTIHSGKVNSNKFSHQLWQIVCFCFTYHISFLKMHAYIIHFIMLFSDFIISNFIYCYLYNRYRAIHIYSLLGKKRLLVKLINLISTYHMIYTNPQNMCLHRVTSRNTLIWIAWTLVDSEKKVIRWLAGLMQIKFLCKPAEYRLSINS